MTKEELEELDRLSKDKKWEVRQRAAENPNCPAEILDRLSQDPDWRVRRGVAGNPNCPIDLLDRLSEDEYWWVRMGVAGNPNTPVEILVRLWRSRSNLRQGVAGNPNCPVDLLVRLIGDEDEDVKKAATESLRRRKETASPEEKEMIEAWETLSEIGVI